MLEKYTFDEKDFEDTGFGKGPMMKGFVAAKDLSFRTGFGKLNPGDSREATRWNHEFCYVRSEEAKMKSDVNSGHRTFHAASSPA